MTTMAWIIVVGVLYIAAVLIAAESTVDRNKKRTPDGKMRIRRDSFAINLLFRSNSMEKEKNHSFPGDICSLYKGFVWGMPLFLIAIFMVCVILGVIFCVSFPFGFVVDLKSYGGFHPYQRFGKKGKRKFIAPWKIIIPIVLFVYRVDIWEFIVAVFGFISETATRAFNFYFLMYMVLAIGIVAAIFSFNSFTKSDRWTVLKEYARSKKEKVCRRVELV